MDNKIKEALNKEIIRQDRNIELIASENYVSKDILALQGSIFTNKYAEGYPSNRYYSGCQNVDTVESLAINYACKLFNSKYANVQPHSGSGANMAIYKALLNINDKILGMNLDAGGHLTHGFKINFSGLDYDVVSYGLTSDGIIDYEMVEKLAIKHKPKLIIAGASAYSREINFKRFREIADKVGAYLMVDMAHIAGLVAANLHPNPLEYADVVSTTTHKTLRGPRGGMILTNNEDIIKKVNKTVFPGIQGGPLMHVIAAKAQCFYEALNPNFITYQKQVLANIKALASVLSKEFDIVSSTTDNHLILVDLTKLGITGKEASLLLEEVYITVNKNSIPNDINTPNNTSGIRIGSPAMTTRGLIEDDFVNIGNIIIDCLKQQDTIENLRKRVTTITSKYPLKGDLL